MIRRIQSTSEGAVSSGKIKDCTVRALANIKDMPYEQAEQTLRNFGRKNNKGCQLHVWVPAYESFGIKMVGIYGRTNNAKWVRSNYPSVPCNSSITIGKLIDGLNKNKKYVVLIRGHVFAVVDGCIIDIVDNHAQWQVVALFELEESTKGVFKTEFVD